MRASASALRARQYTRGGRGDRGDATPPRFSLSSARNLALACVAAALLGGYAASRPAAPAAAPAARVAVAGGVFSAVAAEPAPAAAAAAPPAASVVAAAAPPSAAAAAAPSRVAPPRAPPSSAPPSPSRASSRVRALEASCAAAAAAAAAASPPPPPGRLGGVMMAAAGVARSDAAVALLSLAAAAPDAVLLLIAHPEDVPWLAALACGAGEGEGAGAGAGAGGAPGALLRAPGGAPAPARARPRLLMRVYSWAALSSRLPPAAAALNLKPSPRRVLMYPLMLDELARAAAGAPDDADAVLFSNLPPAARRPPDALFLCDSRDVAFQADPFPAFWRAFEAELAGAGAGAGAGGVAGGVAGAGGSRAPAAPAAPLAPPSPPPAAPALLLVAGELGGSSVGGDDWNRETVHACFAYLGEALVYDALIHCAGTTFGSPAGIRAYAAAMAAGFRACNDMGYNGGTDQGVHNVLTHAYARARLDELRAAAAREGGRGPYAVNAGPHRAPIAGAPVPRASELLDAVDALARGAVVRVARTEDGHVCTMALVVRAGRVARGPYGEVLALDAPGAPCAVVHQYDRAPELYSHFRALFPLPPEALVA